MIELALITSLKIVAIHVCCWQGMILGGIRPLLHWVPEFIKKPLYLCVICMPSTWGVFFWVLSGRYISIDTLWFVLIICGINSLFSFALSYSPYNPINQDI